MNENTVRKMVKKLSPSSIESWFSLVISAPVSVSVWLSAGSAAWIRSASSASEMLPSLVTTTASMKPGLPTKDSRRREVEQCERRAARRRDVAVAGDADEGELARPALGHDLDGVAELVVGLVGRAACRARPRRR